MTMLFQTSGSTGVPKKFEASDELMEARAESRKSAKGPEFAALKSIFCEPHPATTTAGYTYQLWAKRHGVRFFYQTGGSMTSAWKLFQDEGIEGIVGCPGGLVNYAMAAGTNQHRFRLVLSTGGELAARHIPAIRSKLGNTLIASYGASEVGTIALANAEELVSKPGCVGKLCPNVEVKFDDKGYLWAKTATMISGYLDPSLTAQHFQDGYFLTGDQGEMLNGFLFLQSRRVAPRPVVKASTFPPRPAAPLPRPVAPPRPTPPGTVPVPQPTATVPMPNPPSGA
jgi:acyl-coenzyme A synthetase/AMP-(fatty) acid ligase